MFRQLKYFKYERPSSLQEALEILRVNGEAAKLLAGGLDVVTSMRSRKIDPKLIVDINYIPQLDHFYCGERGVVIGARAFLSDIEKNQTVKNNYQALYEGLKSISSVQVKRTGTLVGNICVGTPASDIAPPLMIFGAKIKAFSALGGRREIALSDFYLSPRKTNLLPHEMVEEIAIPAVGGGSGRSSCRSSSCGSCGSAFLRLARTEADISKVSVAVFLELKIDVVVDVKIAFGSIAPTPLRAKEIETLLKNNILSDTTVNQAAELAADSSCPISDIRSHKDYRRQMVQVLLKRALKLAAQRARMP